MKEPVRITVGRRDGDIRGADNRALQAAVDYVARLGGGVVEIGDGEYLMRDSLHLRSHVTVRGHGARTVLRKDRGQSSPLVLDGDYGEEQVTLEVPDGFEAGDGLAVWDKNAGGFHTTVARITSRDGNTLGISAPLRADCMVADGALAARVFPVVSGVDVDDVGVEDLTVDGNKAENPVTLNGCVGAGIYLYHCAGAAIERCTVRGYNGDGISFQKCEGTTVVGCVCEGNCGLGLHPGSGSQRPVVRECTSRDNDGDGLFVCWRVKNGLFEGNTIEGNRGFGISIGHKDTDNVIRRNRVSGNHGGGVFFRLETEGMAAHRNRVEDNVIENNGVGQAVAGIRVRGETRGLVFKGNTIRDTRPAAERRQQTGILLEEKVGDVTLEGNTIDAPAQIEDRRGK